MLSFDYPAFRPAARAISGTRLQLVVSSHSSHQLISLTPKHQALTFINFPIGSKCLLTLSRESPILRYSIALCLLLLSRGLTTATK
jgi:hypothetical protein